MSQGVFFFFFFDRFVVALVSLIVPSGGRHPHHSTSFDEKTTFERISLTTQALRPKARTVKKKKKLVSKKKKSQSFCVSACLSVLSHSPTRRDVKMETGRKIVPVLLPHPLPGSPRHER